MSYQVVQYTTTVIVLFFFFINYSCTLQEQFHIGLDTPLQNKKTHEVAVRANTHFVAFRKENINTGGNAALVCISAKRSIIED